MRRPLVVLLVCGLGAVANPSWATDHAPATPPSPTEAAPAPKEPKKPEAPKHDTASEGTSSKPAKEPKDSGKDAKEPTKDGKAESAPAKAKTEAKPEGKGEGQKEAGKKDTGEKLAPVDPEPPPAPAKAEVPPKRPLGSTILTVKLAMLADPLLTPYDIEVEMDGDKAVLSGKVATEDEKRRAAEIAQSIEPIKAIVNKLEINKDVGAALVKRQDQAILQYVKERFSRSETLKAAGFDVKCEGGVVTLSGKTRFQVFALEAAQAARQVPGVRAVDATTIQLSGEGKE